MQLSCFIVGDTQRVAYTQTVAYNGKLSWKNFNFLGWGKWVLKKQVSLKC